MDPDSTRPIPPKAPAPGAEKPFTLQDLKSPAATDFSVDASALSTVYANFCRVMVTPEELVLDFGLNTQLPPTPGDPVKLTHRVVMNYFTAKRLLLAMSQAVKRHEDIYGVLELDFNKRAKPRQEPPK